MSYVKANSLMKQNNDETRAKNVTDFVRLTFEIKNSEVRITVLKEEVADVLHIIAD